MKEQASERNVSWIGKNEPLASAQNRLTRRSSNLVNYKTGNLGGFTVLAAYCAG